MSTPNTSSCLQSSVTYGTSHKQRRMKPSQVNLSKKKQQEGERTERSTEPTLPSRQHHRRVRSVPPSIHRSHSLPPRFVCNKWGSEETRKSYTCLCSLAKDIDCKRCISNSTLKAIDMYSLGTITNTKWRHWWGNFLDLSSEDRVDNSATDDE